MSVDQRVMLRRGSWSRGRLLPASDVFPATVASRFIGHTPIDGKGNQYPQEPAVALQFDAGPLVVMFERFAEGVDLAPTPTNHRRR